MRLFLIDDNEDVRTGLTKYLQMAGHRVLSAPDGRQAVETLSAFSFDAIVLDLMMPKLDGLGFLKELRENPRHAGTPVLVHTANVSPKARETAVALGVQGFVSKGPGSWDEIRDALTGLAAAKAS
jgi:CheY-like chemotaxis protein